MEIKRLKKFSIKFGIICGMIVTATSVFNAVLNSVQKWNETFDKNEEIAMVDDTNSWSWEQRIVGDLPEGVRLNKSVEYPEDPTPEPVTESLDEPIVDELPEEAPSSFAPVQKRSWFSVWFVYLFVGAFIWYGCYRLGKKIGEEEKDLS